MRRLLLFGAVLACGPTPCPFVPPERALPAPGLYTSDGDGVYNLRLGDDGGFVFSHIGSDAALCIHGAVRTDDGGMTLLWTSSGQTAFVTAVAGGDAGLIIEGPSRDVFGAQASCDGTDYWSGSQCVPGTPEPCTFEKAASNCH